MRELSKINYHIHTDAVKKLFNNSCIDTTGDDIYMLLLNMPLHGKTATQWRNEKEIKEKLLILNILLQLKNFKGKAYCQLSLWF